MRKSTNKKAVVEKNTGDNFFNSDAKSKHQENELRRLNAQIKRQSEIFDSTLSTITDFAYIFNKNGRFIYSNQPLLDLLGINLEEIIGKNFFDLNYPDELAARHQREIQEVLETGKPFKAELPFIGPTGARGLYEYILNPVFADDDSVELVVGSTRDITKRKRNEANLAFLADFSQALIPLSTEEEIVRIFGEKMNRLVNASGCAFFEVNETKDEGVCNNDWHLVRGRTMVGKYDIREFVRSEFQEMMSDGKPFVVRDVKSDLRVCDREKFEALEVGAFVNIPLIRRGVWKFALGVYHEQPYDWRDDEITLLVESTNRIWSKLERERAEQALRESEELRRALVKNLPGGAAFVIDHDFRYLLAEGEALAAAALKPQDLVGKTIFDALAPELATAYKTQYEKALTGGTFIFEHSSYGRDYITHGTPLRAADGEVYAALAVSYDISNHKKVEKALRESEERERLIVQSVKEYAIITTDTSGTINGWNPGAQKMFGYTESEIFGQNCEILFTPEDRKKDVPTKEMREAIEKGSVEDERVHIRKDGSRFFYSGVIQPFKNGKIDGFVKIARDLTERIRAEHAERDKMMLQKLVGAQEDERKRIARDLHDELGQLLTGLRLKLEAVRKLCGEENAELLSRVDETQLIAKHLDAGIDFLAWELRPAALDDLGLCAALAKYVREWSHYAGVTAELLESGIRKRRLAHEVETNLYRIAQEALNNVHKHAAASHVEVLFDQRSNLIVLIIHDNGRGFDTESKLIQNAGIGLIGMKERAALIGGSLEIESSPGKGTTVFVRVPASFTARESLDD